MVFSSVFLVQSIVSYLTILIIGFVAMVAMFALIWLLQWRIENAGIVDVFWGSTVGVVGLFYCIAINGLNGRSWLVGTLTAVWAARLSSHLWTRYKGHPEDKRYTALKQHWGNAAQFRMFRFYQMQALGAFLFSLAVFLAAKNDAPWAVSDLIGVVVWLIAVVGEAMSDRQLQKFKQDPNNKGEVCNNGWWRYSRHPNYFFEFLHWCSYVFLAFATPFWWLTFLMPAAMFFFLTKVTGIPLAEKQSVISRGDKYREYQRTTNAFFPWFPKTKAS